MLARMSFGKGNKEKNGGRGRTGALYSVARAGACWSVSVDGDVLCLVEDQSEALARTEYFEALRHVIHAREDLLSDEQLRQADLIAREMRDATRDTCADVLPVDELEAMDLYGQQLDALVQTIGAELARRKDAAPLGSRRIG
jgi:hypothetical protein